MADGRCKIRKIDWWFRVRLTGSMKLNEPLANVHDTNSYFGMLFGD
jgi:hypothetical protein